MLHTARIPTTARRASAIGGPNRASSPAGPAGANGLSMTGKMQDAARGESEGHPEHDGGADGEPGDGTPARFDEMAVGEEQDDQEQQQDPQRVDEDVVTIAASTIGTGPGEPDPRPSQK